MKYKSKKKSNLQINAIQLFYNMEQPIWFKELVTYGVVNLQQNKNNLIEVMIEFVPIKVKEGMWFVECNNRYSVYTQEQFDKLFVQETPSEVTLNFQDTVESTPEEIDVVIKKPRTRRVKTEVINNEGE